MNVQQTDETAKAIFASDKARWRRGRNDQAPEMASKRKRESEVKA
jgi:hypothetical protein